MIRKFPKFVFFIFAIFLINYGGFSLGQNGEPADHEEEHHHHHHHGAEGEMKLSENNLEYEFSFPLHVLSELITLSESGHDEISEWDLIKKKDEIEALLREKISLKINDVSMTPTLKKSLFAGVHEGGMFDEGESGISSTVKLDDEECMIQFDLEYPQVPQPIKKVDFSFNLFVGHEDVGKQDFHWVLGGVETELNHLNKMTFSWENPEIKSYAPQDAETSQVAWYFAGLIILLLIVFFSIKTSKKM